ncbi:MAG: hypothetical protein HOP29_18640 [Phycisphaerales bacterium]|nr:hypothetical protein [Phycisphaerales bacterium]
MKHPIPFGATCVAVFLTVWWLPTSSDLAFALARPKAASAAPDESPRGDDPRPAAPGGPNAYAEGDTDADGIADHLDNCPDVSNPTQADCNGDGEGDACALFYGADEDCNHNAVPDACDVHDVVSLDADANGVPDECQVGPCELPTLPDPTIPGSHGSRFGARVAAQGDDLVVGGSQVFHYTYNGVSWGKERRLYGSGNGILSNSLAMHGDVIVVGDYRDGTLGTNAGAASVFARHQGGTDNWGFVVKLTASGGGPNDEFGSSVSVRGDVICVGAPRDRTPGGSYVGSAYIYRLDGDAWIEEQKIEPSSAANGLAGGSVGLSDQRLFIGAPGVRRAYVYVYDDDATEWVLSQTLAASDDVTGNQFGQSVALWEDWAVVGAPGAPGIGGAANRGAAYLFQFDGAQWIERRKLVAPGGGSDDKFAWSVALDGGLAVVGVPGSGYGGLDTGTMYIYRFQGATGDWPLESRFPASPLPDGSELGYGVAVRGRDVFVGAPDNSGKLHIYRLMTDGFDIDGDGWSDACDTCPDVANDQRVDLDGDGVGDTCDDDADGDTVNDNEDNCLGISNPNQADCDGDGEGDPCEDDYDGSGVPDDCEGLVDCDDSGFPDVVESNIDCNGNGQADRCDIASGISDDCNANGRPDDCELQGVRELYVCNRDGDSIAVFDGVTGDARGYFVPPGGGPGFALDYANHIVFGPDGFAYVSSSLTNRVLELDAGGNFRRQVSANQPVGLLFRDEDDLLIAQYASNEVRIGRLPSLSIGWWSPITSPADLVLTPWGTVLVSSQGDAREIGERTANGASLGVRIPQSLLGGNPMGLLFDDNDTLLVAVYGLDSVRRYQRVEAGGAAFVDDFIAPGSGGLDGPEGLAWGPPPQRNLFVASRETDEILEFDRVTGAPVDHDPVAPGVQAAFASGDTLSAPTYFEFRPLLTISDCQFNGNFDACDIADGTSADCNADGVPDECPGPDDCQPNGIPDECDIAGGTSADCNADGIPDECQSPEDCNRNGVPDICDLAFGVSGDCNVNAFPDECDIAFGESDDCNANGRPDECETDCNANATPDDCDTASGTSSDCNTNSVPDECELDCNGDHIPDDCDIALGYSLDVDENGIADECERIWYVKADGTGDGTSWDSALPHPYVALLAADAFDEIWIAEGVYQSIEGYPLVLSGEAAIYGGFVGGETDVDQRDPASHVTTLRGYGKDAVLAGSGLDGFILDGLTIERGSTGILLDHSDARLVNVTVQGNYGVANQGQDGCGVRCVEDCHVRMSDCTIRDSRGSKGAAENAGGNGISVYVGPGSTLIAERCTMGSNIGGEGGGSTQGPGRAGGSAYGVHAVGSIYIRLDACHLAQNQGDYGGLGGDYPCCCSNDCEEPYPPRCSYGSGPGGAGVGLSAEGAGKVELFGCLFEENRGSNGGGTTDGGSGIGVRVEHSDTLVKACRIIRNTGGRGGVTVEDGLCCSCAGAGGWGAGLERLGDRPCTVTDSVFVGNYGGRSLFSDCCGDNRAGSGAAIWGADGAQVRNCTFVNNGVGIGTVGGEYGGVGAGIFGAASISNSIFWQIAGPAAPDTGDIRFSCRQGSSIDSNGNFGDDPMFVDLENGDLRLLPGSPCIDAGDPQSVDGFGGRDADGLPRVQCGRVDVGAYEFGIGDGAGDFESDGVVDLFDHGAFIACYRGPDGGIVVPECGVMDQDCDHDVDLIDWAFFQIAANAK